MTRYRTKMSDMSRRVREGTGTDSHVVRDTYIAKTHVLLHESRRERALKWLLRDFFLQLFLTLQSSARKYFVTNEEISDTCALIYSTRKVPKEKSRDSLRVKRKSTVSLIITKNRSNWGLIFETQTSFQ